MAHVYVCVTFEPLLVTRTTGIEWVVGNPFLLSGWLLLLALLLMKDNSQCLLLLGSLRMQ